MAVETPPPKGSITLVPASAYAVPFARARSGPHSNCCDPNVDFEMENNTWNGRGPSANFCDGHREKTLQAQYRFLPALAHARAKRGAAFRKGALDWLVMPLESLFSDHHAVVVSAAPL